MSCVDNLMVLLKHTEIFYHDFTSTNANCDVNLEKVSPYKTCAIWGNGRVKQYDGATFQVIF